MVHESILKSLVSKRIVDISLLPPTYSATFRSTIIASYRTFSKRLTVLFVSYMIRLAHANESMDMATYELAEFFIQCRPVTDGRWIILIVDWLVLAC